MSPSPDAFLVYGFHLGSFDDHLESLDWIFDGDVQARIYAAYKGPDDSEEPTEEFPDPGRGPDGQERELTSSEQSVIDAYRAYWLNKRRVVEAAGIDFQCHGYGEQPDFTLYVEVSMLHVEWGEVADAGAHLEKHEVLLPTWRATISQACDRLGVTWERPKWLLLARYW